MTLEEQQLRILELTEEIRVLKENNETYLQRIRDLEKTNTSLYNKVISSYVSQEEPKQEKQQVKSMSDFTKSLLGGQK